jgi:hypothetical protein
MPLPAHLREIIVPALIQEDDHSVKGRVVCPCGEDEIELMYPGQTHEYNGSLIPCTAMIDDKFFFLLRADCPKCNSQHLLFDADFHGWDGFICHNKEQASLPRPPLFAWKCSSCGSTRHKVEMTVSGESIEEFEENAGEEFGIECWPESFGWVSVDVCCGNCQNVTTDLVSYETM